MREINTVLLGTNCALERIKSSASESGVKKCLEDLRSNTLEDAKEYGSNHWKVILKLALADSEWYAKYLEKQIKKETL